MYCPLSQRFDNFYFILFMPFYFISKGQDEWKSDGEGEENLRKGRACKAVTENNFCTTRRTEHIDHHTPITF